MNTRDWARLYLRLREHPIPVAPHQKNPVADGWEAREFRAEDFPFEGGNIGLRGDTFRGALDCDFALDDPARFNRSKQVLDMLLTAGGVPPKLSRARKGFTGHFRSTVPLKSTDFRHLHIQLIGPGRQTIVEPSVADGIPRRWEGSVEPWDLPEVDGDRLVTVLRVTDTLMPMWEQDGKRHDCALGLRKFVREHTLDIGIGRAALHLLHLLVPSGGFEDHLRVFEQEQASGKEYSTLDKAVYRALLSVLKGRAALVKDAKPVSEHAVYVADVMKRFSFATMKDTGELYALDAGVYRPNAESLIRAEVEMVLFEEEDSAKKTLVEEVVDAVRRRTYIDRSEFNPPGKLCLLNGVLDISNLEFGPHSRPDRFTRQLPVGYDPSAACPTWLQVLETLLPDPRNREIVQRLFGACLEAGNPHQVAFMAYGPGNNGKSTVLGTLGELLGRENIATETLQTLSENRFAAGRLWDKLANVCADIPASIIRYTGTFKELTGGDWMRGEEKFRPAFNFVNPAKLVFSANALPEVNDKTVAFWRRWVLIPFDVDLTGREDRALPVKLRAELPGILNWALQGLREFRAAGSFGSDTSADSLMEEWKRRSDPLYWFLEECVTDDPLGTVTKEDFYSRYGLFCLEKNLRGGTRNQVGERLRELRPAVKQEHPTIDGKRVWTWAGLAWKETALEYVPNGEGPVPSVPSVPGDQRGMDRTSGTEGILLGEASNEGTAASAKPATNLESQGPTSRVQGVHVVGPAQPNLDCERCFQRPSWRVGFPGDAWLHGLCLAHVREFGINPEDAGSARQKPSAQEDPS